MGNVTEEKWIEMLEKKADGNYVAKYPKVKSKSGVTFDEHVAEDATGAHTPKNVGLSDVQNYKIATKTEAETGIANNKYMTPLRVKESIFALSAKIATGSYTGNAVDDRSISVGFTPSLVIVTRNNGTMQGIVGPLYGMIHSTLSTNHMDASGNLEIQANGFVVDGGMNSRFNDDGTLYEWVAIG